MNEPQPERKPIQLDIPASLKCLAALTAMLTALQRQSETQSAPVSITEPTTPTAQFASAGADAIRVHKSLTDAIENLLKHAPMNQKMVNLLAMMHRDIAQLSGNLKAAVLDIAVEVKGFEHIEPRPPEPPSTGDEWKGA